MHHAEPPESAGRSRWERFGRRQKGAAGPGRAAAPGALEFLAGAIPDPFRDAAMPGTESGLTAAERAEAEQEARQAAPLPTAVAPVGGELRVQRRFLAAIAHLREKANEAHASLDEVLDRVWERATEISAAARAERQRVLALPESPAACDALDQRHADLQNAEAELLRFRRVRGIPDTAVPRPPSRSWWVWLVVIGFTESAFNGAMLHASSSGGVVVNWLFAAGIAVLTVGFFGWAIGGAVRQWRFAGILKRGWLAGGLLAGLTGFVLVHVGFAHFRDATQALTEAAKVDAEIGLTQTGRENVELAFGVLSESGDEVVPEPHPKASPISTGAAVLNELRAQFGWSPPGWEVVRSHPSPDPDDHASDVVQTIPPGELGYQVRGGEFWRVHDERAGHLDDWKSLVLLILGVVSVALAAIKWHWRSEPTPDWDRLDRAVRAARDALDDAYLRALDGLDREETEHRERLNRADADLESLSRTVRRLRDHRRRLLDREDEQFRETTETATAVVEDYRAANRARRPRNACAPGFWETPWILPKRPRDPRAILSWDAEYEDALARLADLSRRVAAANDEFHPKASARFRERREQVAEAARKIGPRVRRSAVSTAARQTDPNVAELGVPAKGPVARMRVAS